MLRLILKRMLTTSLGCVIIGFSSNLFAAYTQSFANSISSAGNAYAGTAAVTDDASVQYYNPAGLSDLDQQQYVIGGALYFNRATFRGTTVLIPANFSQTGTANSNSMVEIPAIYYTVPIYPRFTLGLGFSALGGAGNNFPNNSILRYTSTKTMVGIVNFSPSLAYKLNESTSIGFGIDGNYITADQNSMTPGPTPGALDSTIHNSAYAVGYNWHAGILYHFTPRTKLGLAYRSRVNFHLNGNSEYILNPGTPLKTEFTTSDFKFDTAFAPSSNISLYHEINNQWSMMAGIDYTQWSILKSFNVSNIATPLGAINLTTPLNFHDSWRFAIGANYKGIDKWVLRAGLTYDQDPSDHSVLFADNVATTNVYLLGLGARYYYSKCVSADFAYGHYFFEKININYNNEVNQQIGTFSQTNSNLIGMQINVTV